ncbi:E3 ubiquitin-protein ligase Arkadia [Trichinella pseudospiralis]|uniref:E3 ubiquitin-protein ligase Arkadia n=1 Tax=Trichinella pseudospiralis TaxID=6337 RepID=A0A0V1J3T2_TRIPS|nr:E3 ubiquitin-protein ligase Arkadia [Trichinella pseudospiralis]KRZ29555.1 E3 ubiquitin-protein ligase Arkadia [Trichinella pseudospiralis]KRZ36100.1 E3 ubiquitin-protein ligase Arkadia [Trichinella pseudospiralis]
MHTVKCSSDDSDIPRSTDESDTSRSSDESDILWSSDESEDAAFSSDDDTTSTSTDEEEQRIESESEVNGSASEVQCNKQMLEPRTVKEKQGIKRKSSQMNESNSETQCKKQEMQFSSLDGDSSSSTLSTSSFGNTPVPSPDSVKSASGNWRPDASSQSNLVDRNLADVASATNSDNSAINTQREISVSNSTEEVVMADVEIEIDSPRLDNNVSVAQNGGFVSPQFQLTSREEESSPNIFALGNPATPTVQDTHTSSPADASDRSAMNFPEDSIDPSHLEPSSSRQSSDAQNGQAATQFLAPQGVVPMMAYLDQLRNRRHIIYPEWIGDNVPVQQRRYLARQREQFERRRMMHARWLHERALLMRSVLERIRGRAQEEADVNDWVFYRVREELDPNLQVVRDLQQSVGRNADRILSQGSSNDDSDGSNNSSNDIRQQFPIRNMQNPIMVYMAMEFQNMSRGADRVQVSNLSNCAFLDRLGIPRREECRVHLNRGFCTVCLNRIEHDEFIRVLSCGHFYHVSCIDRWLVINDSCAVCRQEASRGDYY